MHGMFIKHPRTVEYLTNISVSFAFLSSKVNAIDIYKDNSPSEQISKPQ